jgi:hypothetical protein
MYKTYLSGAVVACALGAGANAAGVAGTSAAAYQQEAVVTGSIASGGDFTTRIQFGNGNESRGVYEFALPTLPVGGTYTSAAINYNVAESNFGNGNASQLRFFGFRGNGRYDAADANATGSPAGLSPKFFGDVSSAQSTALSTSVVNAAAGSSWFGVTAWQEQEGFRTGLGRGGSGGPAPTLSYTADVPTTGTLSTRAMVDARINNGVLEEGSDVITTQELGFASIQRRGILEFNLAGLPAGAVITSASLKFDVAGITSGSTDGGPDPLVYGYNGNGVAGVTDGSQTGNLIATGPEVTNLGDYAIAMDPSKVQALRGSNSIVGLLIGGSADGNQFGFYTSDSTFAGNNPVTLDVTYAVPEPASMAALLVGGLLLARRRSR